MSASAAELRDLVESNFPALWPAVNLCLSTCATLLLAENVNPTAVVLVGGPSAGKTTVANMFEGALVRVGGRQKLVPLVYRSDKFTPASFVSHAVNRTTRDLAKVDLLPRIKNRVLLTPELAPIFRGKEDELTNAFSVITRILDGQGYETDSGTHGHRGYSGRHVFAWIGCTTPFDDRVWRVMSQLGSRLFFLLMEAEQRVTVDDLVAATTCKSYDARHRECRGAVQTFLRALFDQYRGVSSVEWDGASDDRDALWWIARCAALLAAMRSIPQEERNGNTVTYRPGDREQPYRALSVLTNVARGHALVHGRSSVTLDDVPLIVRVTVSSMPGDVGSIFRALVESGGAGLTVADVQRVLGAKHPQTARRRMAYMHALDVTEFDERGAGRAAGLHFRPDWQWCTSPEFRALVRGEPITAGGLCGVAGPISAQGSCVPLSPNNLVERPGGEGERGEVHNPYRVTA